MAKPTMKYETYLALGDFGLIADKAVTTGAWQRIGTYTVLPQMLATFGVGNTKNGVDTRETLKMDFNSATATPILNMKVRLSITDAQENRKIKVGEWLSQSLASGVKIAEFVRQYAGEDSKLIIDVLPAAAVTIDISECSANIPTTQLA